VISVVPVTCISKVEPNTFVSAHDPFRAGGEAQQQDWLVPLLNGEIRSAFSMDGGIGPSLHNVEGRAQEARG
jgi:hypothetical protein